MSQKYFLQTAQVAAHLYFAALVAKQLSITAKNSHAVSARAGQQASGFRAITGFIEDMANKVITQADQISEAAVSILSLAAMRERTMEALDIFNRVSRKAEDAAYIGSLNKAKILSEKKLEEIDEELRKKMCRLELQLEETNKQIRAASIISSTSKVEASQAGSFQPQLDVIADNIAEAATQIKKHLADAQNLLCIAH